MRFCRYQRAKEQLELNLVPVMNLFVVLIPFLLLAAAFYHVRVIPTVAPLATNEPSAPASEARAVTLSLSIGPDRLELRASNPTVAKKTLAKLGVVLEKEEGRFDLDALSEALYQIKLRYEQSDTIIVIPHDETAYRDVVEILDTAREITMDPGTREETRIPLFPVVVMSREV